MRRFCLIAVLMLSSTAGQALTLSGNAMSPRGGTVRVIIKFENGLPTDVRLHYAPLLIPSNPILGDQFPPLTIYNGVEGYDFRDYVNVSESLTSILNYHDLKPRPAKLGTRTLPAKVDRNELSIIRWDSYTGGFVPVDGSERIVTESNPTPGTQPHLTKDRSNDIVRVEGSLDRTLEIKLDDRLEFDAYPSGITYVEISLRRVGPKKWRLKISTVRVYFNSDVGQFLHTTDFGFVRER